jgi:hypothetical protein
MATYTPMDYWLELDIPELMEHARDVQKIIKDAKG